MPDKREFAKGFNLKIGLTLGDLELTGLDVDEVSVVRFNEYSYPMVLEFQTSDQRDINDKDRKELLKLLDDRFGGERVIRTPSNRPYKCTFQDPLKGEPKIEIKGNTIKAHCVGHSKRIKEAEAKEFENEQ